MKKVAFITHAFHAKSKSVNILAQEFFNPNEFTVEYFYVDDWTINSSGLDNYTVGYDIVVIIQIMSLDLLKKVQCDHIIFIPMYDFSYSWNILKWIECFNLKILSPSKKIHETLVKAGFTSYYFKYYPEPDLFIPGDIKKLYLWQRINNININTALKLLNNFPLQQIHIHKAVDPGHDFVEPLHEDRINHNIIFSDWFENKTEYLNILKQSGIYMAPRIMEGGAASFIDAMKMGKVVIAHNESAMNEYIIHNETGLLYDVDNISALDFESIDLLQIQRNTYQSVQEGRALFLNSIPDILNFIETKKARLIPESTLDTIKVASDSLLNLDSKLSQLEDLLKQKECILKNDRWYIFGQLSLKEKINILIKILIKKLHRSSSIENAHI